MTDVKVIIGANAGDEGKGGCVDYFAHKALVNNKKCLVVLSNGGSQRGHTVTLPNGTRHVFRHFGSGSFSMADTYIPSDYIVNPMNYMLEYRDLNYCINKVYMSSDCLLTTPFDMIANQLIEDSRGEHRYGSCGVGIWETILRNGFRVRDFISASREYRINYLKFVRDNDFKKRIDSKGIKLSSDWEKIIFSNNLIYNYIADFEKMLNSVYIICTIGTEEDYFKKYDYIIFENGQGLLIGQEYNLTRNSTPSNTGLKNPANLIKNIEGDVNVEVCYVTRTYLTRHGAGDFYTERDPYRISNDICEDKTNVQHPYQGRLRYGVMDWEELEKRCSKDFDTYKQPGWKMSYFVTHMNELRYIPKPLFFNNNFYVSDGFTRENVYENICN